MALFAEVAEAMRPMESKEGNPPATHLEKTYRLVGTLPVPHVCTVMEMRVLVMYASESVVGLAKVANTLGPATSPPPSLPLSTMKRES
jgi:hypothetical protein